MIIDKYFEDAFILHDDTVHKKLLRQLNENKKVTTKLNTQNKLDNHEIYNNLRSDKKKETLNEDKRDELSNTWASFKCIFKLQPFDKIRDYFGEKISFYFVWSGMLISTLWIPTIVGIIFFSIGLNKRYHISLTIFLTNKYYFWLICLLFFLFIQIFQH
jgi:hypothetical protein